MLKKLALGVAVLGLTAGVAMAQTPTNFADVDTDSDGELSLVELQVVWPDFTDAEFSGADTDASGGLNVEELNAFQAGAAAGAGAGAVPAPAPADPAAVPAPAPADPMAVPGAGSEAPAAPVGEETPPASLTE